MKNILIIGATSAIASACAQRWVADGAAFFLAGRDERKLRAMGDDLAARGASAVYIFAFDANAYEQHSLMLGAAFENLGRVDIALIAHGTLPDQQACERDAGLAIREFSTNGLSVIALLILLAQKMEAAGTGTIAVISSVAGDRGRPTNYLYGAAKGAVTVFCEGLRARLFKSGVHVLTIKPGFVATPMTQGLPLPEKLVATPEKVAADIVRAVERKTNTLYTPFFWRFIMGIIVHIPTVIFKRMKL